MLNGEFEKRMIALQIEFLTNVLAVFFDGSRADEKLFADFLTRQIFGNQLENSALRRS